MKADSATPESRADPLHKRLFATTATAATDLQRRSARRFGGLALVVSTGWVLTRLVGMIFGLADEGPLLAPSDWIIVTALALSLTMFALTRSDHLGPSTILDIGLVYVVVIAFLISLAENFLPWPEDHSFRGAPYVCWWIIVWPFLVPTRAAKTAMVSLAAALTAPMALKVSVTTFGNPEAGSDVYLRLFLAAALAGIVGLIPSRLLQSLTADVRRARELGNYRLLRRIGSGGMGEVWSAEHKTLARPAAMKIIHRAALGTSSTEARSVLARFEREASATAALRSPHTVVLYDHGTTVDGTFYYVMELLDGFNLASLVKRFGPLPAARVVSILIQVCNSLTEAHERNLIHRDIKPENIFLCRLGADFDFVKVLDFGLVKSTFEPADARLTAEGMTSGTPAYMAPELARGQRDVAASSDLYSLGCVAYFLLAGTSVFQAGTAVHMLLRQIEDRPINVSEIAHGPVPAALESIIMSCLAKDPSQRPASAKKLAKQLRALKLEECWTDEDAETWWHTQASDDPIAGAAADVGPAAGSQPSASLPTQSLRGRRDEDAD